MRRRTFLGVGLGVLIGERVLGAIRGEGTLDVAADLLAKAVDGGVVAAAVLHVERRGAVMTRSFGKAGSGEAMFLLGSISKPICVAGMMTLFDAGKFGLEDPLRKYLPKFVGEGRERVTMRHLLTHTSGLPDQLPENGSLRKGHAGLGEFAEHAVGARLSFEPGSRYQYSSMGILLATQVAEKISGMGIAELVERSVFGPLGMRHSAVGLGKFAMGDMVACQTEHAAPEAGGGDPTAKEWDWNSAYWRKLGAPWGGVHASGPDLGRFMGEFLYARGAVVQAETARRMVSNQNAAGIKPRGLGFDVGAGVGSPGCSEKTFGHTGSTGTLVWADPATETICVVLTSLPAGAVKPHPRDLASRAVARSGG